MNGRKALLHAFRETFVLIALVELGCSSDGGGPATSPVVTKESRPYATWTSSADDMTKGLPGLAATAAPVTNQTVRQIAHVSIGGARIRVKFSNVHGVAPVTLSKVRIAKSLGGSAIDPRTDTAVEFQHADSATIEPGKEVWSDELAYGVDSKGDVAVSTYIADSADAITSHRTAMRTNYMAPGDVASAAEMTDSVQETGETRWMTEIDVFREEGANVVVAFGDSITDGFASTMGDNLRYPDQLSELALATNDSDPQLSVVNAGISGNRWLHDGVGLRGSERFARDVLGTSGVTHVIVLMGINDIGYSVGLAPDEAVAPDDLISALSAAAQAARGASVKVFMGTISPFAGAGYYSDEGETKRQTINSWIRASADVDGVVDFDEALRDPAIPGSLLAAYDSGDHLHPSDAGYTRMAEAVDLSTLR